MRSAIVILAAGSARRMGRIKQLLPWAETTLLGHAVRQAVRTGIDTYVVLGANKELLFREVEGLNVSVIDHPGYAEGLGSSIRVAVDHLQGRQPGYYTHLLIMLADQPAVNTAFLSLLLSTATNGQHVVATDYGDRAGVPAVFPARMFPALQELGGDAGAGRLLNAPDAGVCRLRPPFVLFDIDTPEDYRSHEGNP